jgi:hypothetical protein
MTLTLLLALTLSLPFTLAHAAHMPSLAWMGGLSGNGPCCGTYDCVEATVILLDFDADDAVVQVGETLLTVPSAWVHPSEDGQGWWCFFPRAPLQTYVDAHGMRRAIAPEVPTKANTRCVFYHAAW